MKRRLATLALLCAGAAALPGCANYYYGNASSGPTVVLDANQNAVDQLLANLIIDPNRPVLVSTLVSVDRLNESSRLGRTFSEQIAGRMTQRGVLVIEPRLRDNLMMVPGHGDFLLSRELREVSQSHNAQAVLVGTYSVSTGVVYVSLKLVHALGNAVIAATDYTLPMDANVRGLLHAR